MLDIKKFRHERVVLNLWFHRKLQDMMKHMLEGVGAKVVCLGANDLRRYRDRKNIGVVFFDFMQSSALEDPIRSAIWDKLYMFNMYCPQAITVAVVNAGIMVGERSIVDIAAEPTSSLPQYAYQTKAVVAIPRRCRRLGLRIGLWKDVLPLLIVKQERDWERAIEQSKANVEEGMRIVVENQKWAREQGWT